MSLSLKMFQGSLSLNVTLKTFPMMISAHTSDYMICDISFSTTLEIKNEINILYLSPVR